MGSPTDGLSTAEAAEVLGVHPDTLRAWADQGIVKSWRPTEKGWRRFSRADLEEFRNSRQPDPEAA